MSRIKSCFSILKNNNKKALIPFITAGDPDKETTLTLMKDMVTAGANLIELGVPFSDPMADGPVIQRASERALAKGITTDDVFEIVSKFRQHDETTPVILMGYLNPIEVMGYDVFCQKAHSAGVDGLLIVDLPPEESEDVKPILLQNQLDQIFLLSPTTRGERLDTITQAASGFLYYVSLKGVTGSNQLDAASVAEKLNEIRSKTDLPLGVGFGIKDAQTAAVVGKLSDAVVIGSALVERIANKADNMEAMRADVSEFIMSIRNALDTGIN